jgi:tetratricopeptide (TPR) repeat protein
MLGRYMRLVGPETTILLVSDHGFFSDHRRPRHPKAGWNAPLLWHRPFGIFVAYGPGVRRDELVFGASLLDVAPTVLALLGLPVARDMEGHVLSRIFESPPALETVETHGPSDPGLAAAEVTEDDPWAAQEAIKQLVALGYVEAPQAEAAKAIEAATAQRLHTLAEVHIAKGELEAAMPLLEELIVLRPRHVTARRRLAMCRLHTGDVEGCRQLVRALVDEVLGGNTDHPVVQLAYGMIAFRQQQWDEALDHFLRAEQGLPGFPHVASRIGMVRLRQRRWAEAEAAFRRSLEVDGDHIRAYNGLGVACHRQGRYEEAAEQYLRSIGLRFHQPVAHFQLGVALAASGQLTGAVQSLERALEFAPRLRQAHELLGRIHQTRGDLPRALHHVARAKALERPEPAGAAGA